jgi:hypothetical protein
VTHRVLWYKCGVVTVHGHSTWLTYCDRHIVCTPKHRWNKTHWWCIKVWLMFDIQSGWLLNNVKCCMCHEQTCNRDIQMNSMWFENKEKDCIKRYSFYLPLFLLIIVNGSPPFPLYRVHWWQQTQYRTMWCSQCIAVTVCEQSIVWCDGRTNIKRVPKLVVLAASHSWVKPVQRVWKRKRRHNDCV